MPYEGCGHGAIHSYPQTDAHPESSAFKDHPLKMQIAVTALLIITVGPTIVTCVVRSAGWLQAGPIKFCLISTKDWWAIPHRARWPVPPMQGCGLADGRSTVHCFSVATLVLLRCGKSGNHLAGGQPGAAAGSPWFAGVGEALRDHVSALVARCTIAGLLASGHVNGAMVMVLFAL
jgi:hypothetical protein